MPSVSYVGTPYAGNYKQLLYKSQWIPVRNLQGVDIWYETPPSGTDKIVVTLYGQGENLITSGAQTIDLNPITATNYLNKKRSRLDISDYQTGEAFQGDQVKIVLSTVNTTWQPIIRAINLIK